jgi:hypothetical protein
MLFDVHLSKHAKGIFFMMNMFLTGICVNLFFFIMKRFPIVKLIKMKNEDIFLTMIKLYL